MAVFGYGRVSTKNQNIFLQRDALQKAGCEKIYEEKVSGTKIERAELSKLLDNLRKDDTLIVYSLDRLGRTTLQLVNLIAMFKEKGIHFRSLSEGVFDTTSPMGEAIFQIIAILKSMEVNILKERTKSGLEAARARGRVGGRPKGSFNRLKAGAAANMYTKGATVKEITASLTISRSTLYEYLRAEGVPINAFSKTPVV
jgi:DNA invertase Pin-like site-specific DNA recombinase